MRLALAIQRELARLGFGESAGGAFEFYLSRDGGVEGVGWGQAAVARCPDFSTHSLGDDFLAAHRTLAGLQDADSSFDEAQRLGVWLGATLPGLEPITQNRRKSYTQNDLRRQR